MPAKPGGLFVNASVRHLKRPMGFFRRLGFQFDPRFIDDQAACGSRAEVNHLIAKAIDAGGMPAMDPTCMEPASATLTGIIGRLSGWSHRRCVTAILTN